jgi:hypothetical protein
MNRRRTLIGLTGAIAALAGCSTSLPGARPSTPTFVRFDGEDRELVDVAYRDWTDAQVESRKRRAGQVDYRSLLRNAEARADDNDVVKGEAVIGQALEGDGYQTLLLFVGGLPQQAIYGSWVGEQRLLRGDSIRFWGQVLGLEVYQTGQGVERTVPALSLVDVELLEK